MIDLGLPSGTKWACCNVGASTPEAYGDYYAWGETQTKSVYDWNTYQYGSGNNEANIVSDIAGTQNDAATANWGAPWRMPSLAQIDELLKNTTSEYTTQNSVNGLKFAGANGGSVFFLAAGRRSADQPGNAGSGGFYWSSSLFEGSSLNANQLAFVSSYVYLGFTGRSDGLSVRPVR